MPRGRNLSITSLPLEISGLACTSWRQMMSIWCVLQIVDRISRFAAEMPSMLSCGIRMAGPMSKKTLCAPWWLRSVPGSVSEFGERFGSLVSPGEPGYLRGMRRERWSIIPRFSTARWAQTRHTLRWLAKASMDSVGQIVVRTTSETNPNGFRPNVATNTKTTMSVLE